MAEIQSKVRNWLPVSKLDETPDALIRTSTGYKWHHVHRFPQLFRKVGRELFIDLGLLYELAEKGKLR